MRSILFTLCLLPTIAAAQPTPATSNPPAPANPPPPPANPPPANPPPPTGPAAPADPGATEVVVQPPPPSSPPPPRSDCEQERALFLDTAARISDPDERERLLRKAPDCSGRPPSAYALVAPAEVAPAPLPVRSGLFGEIGAGVGLTSVGGNDGVGGSDSGLGIAGGLGGFVSPNVALSVRLAGRLHIDDVTGFNGFIGPTVQYWIDRQLFFGGGVGLGVSTASCDYCETYTSLGIDARIGYAFSPASRGANMSIEITRNTVDLGDDGYGYDLPQYSLTTVMFGVGYLAF